MEVLSHLFGDLAHTDRGKVVDRESGILGVVHGEHAGKRGFEVGDAESFGNTVDTHLFDHFLKHNLNKDTAGRGGLFLVHMNDVKNCP